MTSHSTHSLFWLADGMSQYNNDFLRLMMMCILKQRSTSKSRIWTQSKRHHILSLFFCHQQATTAIIIVFPSSTVLKVSLSLSLLHSPPQTFENHSQTKLNQNKESWDSSVYRPWWAWRQQWLSSLSPVTLVLLLHLFHLPARHHRLGIVSHHNKQKIPYISYHQMPQIFHTVKNHVNFDELSTLMMIGLNTEVRIGSLKHSVPQQHQEFIRYVFILLSFIWLWVELSWHDSRVVHVQRNATQRQHKLLLVKEENA